MLGSKAKGDLAELKAISYLKDKGFVIIEHNFYFRGGEIDIIAIKNNVLHFVEVKSGDSFEAIYNITPSKIKRLIKGASIYLKQKKLNFAYSIDALILQNEKVEFIENITL